MNFSAKISKTTSLDSPNWKVLYTVQPEPVGYPTVHIIQGSVLDFHSPDAGAIVNAANEGCIGGGGVDGAISRAGGPNLEEDRWALPVLNNTNNAEDTKMQEADDDNDSDSSLPPLSVRCHTGSAVLTGPGDYGALQVPYVIHAVGPNFHLFDTDPQMMHGLQLLQSAYTTSLDIAAADTNSISEVAFSLLSAGIFRGRLNLSTILLYSLMGIKNWEPPPTPEGGNSSNTDPLKSVYICGFTDKECDMLVKVAQHVWKDQQRQVLAPEQQMDETPKSKTGTAATDAAMKDGTDGSTKPPPAVEQDPAAMTTKTYSEVAAPPNSATVQHAPVNDRTDNDTSKAATGITQTFSELPSSASPTSTAKSGPAETCASKTVENPSVGQQQCPNEGAEYCTGTHDAATPTGHEPRSSSLHQGASSKEVKTEDMSSTT